MKLQGLKLQVICFCCNSYLILAENVPCSESYRAPIVNNDTEGFMDSFSGDSIAIKIDYKKYDGEPIEFTEEMISIAYAA